MEPDIRDEASLAVEQPVILAAEHPRANPETFLIAADPLIAVHARPLSCFRLFPIGPRLAAPATCECDHSRVEDNFLFSGPNVIHNIVDWIAEKWGDRR
jgi:hypothetical protein